MIRLPLDQLKAALNVSDSDPVWSSLTPAQQHLLADVRYAGERGRWYNGRSAKTIRRLLDLDLVEAEEDYYRGQYRRRIHVTPKAQP